MPQNKTPLEIYQEIQAMVRKDARDEAEKVYNEKGTETGVAQIPLHEHNGIDTPKINAANIIPNLRASGAITMATDSQVYKLGLNFNPTAVWFQGVAYHTGGGGIDMRAVVNGNAQLGPTYIFQDDGTGTSVTAGGPIQPFIQGSNCMVIDSTTDPRTVRVFTSEENLVYVAYPTSGTVVAAATVIDYGPGVVYVETSLASGWEIVGNFTVV